MDVILDFSNADELEKFLLSKSYEKIELGFGVVAEIDELKVDGECMYIDFDNDNKNVAIISIGEAPCYEGSTCVEEPRLAYYVDITNQDKVRELAKQIFWDL